MAKIPIILEAGRADSKLIKTDNVYDDNQEKFLSDKIKEIDNNHSTLKDIVNSLTNTVNNNELDIENKLETEQTRATNAENNLRETINNITDINEHSATAELITVNTLPNTSSSNVQQALKELFKNATFAGVATPTTNPGIPNGPVFYIASKAGMYSNFNNIVITSGQVVALCNNTGTWSKEILINNNANNITYDNSTSGLDAVTVQDALDTVSSTAHFSKRGSTINISTNYNTSGDAEVLTLSQAINKVPMSDKILGFTMTFLSSDGWKTYQFTGDSISNWTDTTKWASLIHDSELTQKLGDSETNAMSQKGVTKATDELEELTYTSTQANSLITTSGSIVSTEYTYSVNTYSIKDYSKIKVSTDLHHGVYNNSYVIAALYKDNVLVKTISAKENITKYNFILVNNGEADTLKVCGYKPTDVTVKNVEAYLLLDVASKFNAIDEEQQEQDNKIGNYQTLTEKETVTGRFILASTGELSNTQYSDEYDVKVYDISGFGKIFRIITDIKYQLSSKYSIAALYKGDKYLGSLKTAVGSNLVLYDVTAIVASEADTLKVCVKTGGEPIVMQKSGLFFSDSIKQFEDVKDGIISLEKIEYNNTDNSKLIDETGNIISIPYPYSVDTYNISNSILIRIVTDLQSTITNNYSIAAIYDNEGNFIKSLINSDAETKFDLKFLNLCNAATLKVIRSTKKSSTISVYNGAYLVNIDEVKKETFDSKVVFPESVYAMNYNNSLNYLNRIYIEGILTEEVDNASINGNSCVIIDNTNIFDSSTEITLTAPGYTDYKKEISVKKASVDSLKNKKLFLMCIGDSLTDQGYPALCEFITKTYNDDLSNINVTYVGTKIENNSITLGSKTQQCRGCNEGKSGWAISDYLRHITSIRSRYSTNNLPPKVAWDSLGLGTQTRNGIKGRDYVDWTYSYNNSELMRTTCHGYYDADPSEELWNWIVNTKSLKSFNYQDEQITFSESYTSNDDDKQKKAIKYLCENPDNPFFDLNTVQSTNGDYAFNFSTYLSRYKTINPKDGSRLSVGSTAGSKVTNVEKYDVCSPTHVVIIMNENDVNHNDNSDGVGQDLITCAQLLKNYSSSIKIAIGTTRGYGAINPAQYSNWGLVNKAGISVRRLNTWKYMLNNKNSNFDLLPIYAIQSVFGTNNGKAFDPINLNEIERFNGDGLHAGYILGYLDRAYQVVAWIAYTLR